MMIDRKILSWLTIVPSGDINFKNQLEDANVETIQEALKDSSMGKTKKKVLESKLKKLQKQNKPSTKKRIEKLEGGKEHGK